jgi:hypothetical protein
MHLVAIALELEAGEQEVKTSFATTSTPIHLILLQLIMLRARTIPW